MAKRKPTAASVLRDFLALDDSDQQEVVDRLPWTMLTKHPMARIEWNGEEMERQRAQIEAAEKLAAEKAKQLRNPGKPDQNEQLLKLVEAGVKHATIAKKLKMKRAAVSKQLARLRIKYPGRGVDKTKCHK